VVVEDDFLVGVAWGLGQMGEVEVDENPYELLYY